jgi:hypothetical protein
MSAFEAFLKNGKNYKFYWEGTIFSIIKYFSLPGGLEVQ